ncbi:MAG TPA: methyltransferase domain-containing protein [Candidatus Nanoarchaeia archaeon]|nr:methyltransferase domain-containing protein [Candidatus Nanoarchaeia archaeon]
MKRIDLGCKDHKKEGFTGIDVVPGSDVDVVHDLNKGIPFKDGEVDEVFASHFLEHVDNPVLMVQEIYRVLKKGGKATIIVPHFSNPGAYTPLHKTYWSYNAVNAHALKYYFDVDFSAVKVRLNSKFLAFIGINKLVNLLINICPIVYERYLRILMVDEVVVRLVK